MAKSNNDSKKEFARILFMQGEAQNVIAEKTGFSTVTINKWVKAGDWEALRAAATITRPELVNKLLRSINNLLDEVNNTKDPKLLAALGDKLSKFASTIEKLDKKANVVDAIEVFMAFGRWMQYRQTVDPEVTPELIKAINKFQDLYISEQLNK
ncbi:MAG: DUF1804 family protein [Bacteroidales bacterium]|jgi:hypothetical protein|nr:DUF1804 family protein [Bacteroidales bacterium]